MSTNERMSKLEIPAWWTDKVFPMLRSKSVNLTEVARAASAHAGRNNEWDSSSISKFVSPGTGRTMALTNGISAALQIPPPFFVAPTELAASEMFAIVKRELAKLERERPHIDEAVDPRTVVDGVSEREIGLTIVDAAKRRTVVSSDNGAQGGRGVRAQRASKGRPKTDRRRS